MPLAPGAAAPVGRRLLDLAAGERAAGAQALLLAAGGLLALGIATRRWGARAGAAATRAEAEAVVRAALRHQDDTIAQVAHDLKTPLTALKGHAQLLQRALGAADGPEAARLRAGLAAIDAAATAAAERIDRLSAEADPPPEA